MLVHEWSSNVLDVRGDSFFCCEGPRSRCYGRTAALKLVAQHCDEDEEKDDQFSFIFPSNGAPVE
jgi:hypothetical protein